MARLNLNLPRERFFLGPAPVWKRVVAFVIDFIIIELIIFSPIRAVLMKLVPMADLAALQAVLTDDARLTAVLVGMLSFAGVLAMLYFAILEYTVGMTLGKRLMRISVVSANGLRDNGPRDNGPRFWQCVVRSLFLVPISPLPLFWLLDPAFLIFSKSNARLLERLSKTQTVERMVM